MYFTENILKEATKTNLKLNGCQALSFEKTRYFLEITS
jgi:hypothetical protein